LQPPWRTAVACGQPSWAMAVVTRCARATCLPCVSWEAHDKGYFYRALLFAVRFGIRRTTKRTDCRAPELLICSIGLVVILSLFSVFS
jgi:hypothetical protein